MHKSFQLQPTTATSKRTRFESIHFRLNPKLSGSWFCVVQYHWTVYLRHIFFKPLFPKYLNQDKLLDRERNTIWFVNRSKCTLWIERGIQADTKVGLIVLWTEGSTIRYLNHCFLWIGRGILFCS